jgi:hypothetical protein
MAWLDLLVTYHRPLRAFSLITLTNNTLLYSSCSTHSLIACRQEFYVMIVMDSLKAMMKGWGVGEFFSLQFASSLLCQVPNKHISKILNMFLIESNRIESNLVFH